MAATVTLTPIHVSPASSSWSKRCIGENFIKEQAFWQIDTGMERFRDIFDAESVTKVSFASGAKRFYEISIQSVTRRNVR